MDHRSIVWTLGAVVALWGCGDDDGMTATDAGSDARVTIDAGTDAGPTDEDAGPSDAGSMDDAGMDAGDTSDAGFDAGSDAGSDAGTSVTPSASGDLVITEIQAAPVGYGGDDSQAEWLEVYNPSATVTYNLNGCFISDNLSATDYEVMVDVLVPPGAYITLSSRVFTVATHGFVSAHSWEDMVGGFSGGGDAPNINCGGVSIDTVAYGAAGGFPDLVAMEGRTLSLDPDFLDATSNDVGANWCYGAGVFFTAMGEDNFGTPGTVNPECP